MSIIICPKIELRLSCFINIYSVIKEIPAKSNVNRLVDMIVSLENFT